MGFLHELDAFWRKGTSGCVGKIHKLSLVWGGWRTKRTSSCLPVGASNILGNKLVKWRIHIATLLESILELFVGGNLGLELVIAGDLDSRVFEFSCVYCCICWSIWHWAWVAMEPSIVIREFDRRRLAQGKISFSRSPRHTICFQCCCVKAVSFVCHVAKVSLVRVAMIKVGWL